MPSNLFLFAKCPCISIYSIRHVEQRKESLLSAALAELDPSVEDTEGQVINSIPTFCDIFIWKKYHKNINIY